MRKLALIMLSISLSGCTSMQISQDHKHCAKGDTEACSELTEYCEDKGKAKACRALARIAKDNGDSAQEQKWLKQACLARDIRACNQTGVKVVPLENTYSIHSD